MHQHVRKFVREGEQPPTAGLLFGVYYYDWIFFVRETEPASVRHRKAIMQNKYAFIFDFLPAYDVEGTRILRAQLVFDGDSEVFTNV